MNPILTLWRLALTRLALKWYRRAMRENLHPLHLDFLAAFRRVQELSDHEKALTARLKRCHNRNRHSGIIN